MTKDNSRDELALKIVSQNIKEGDFTSDHSTDQVYSIAQWTIVLVAMERWGDWAKVLHRTEARMEKECVFYQRKFWKFQSTQE